MADEIKISGAVVPAVKLDLACGQIPKEGFEGVDLYAPNAKHKVDLWKFPYPWADNSVDELYCSHFIEHLPARSVEERDLLPGAIKEEFLDKDFLFAFFDECYRILKPLPAQPPPPTPALGQPVIPGPLVPGGIMTVVVPSGRSDRGFQDPTHRRYIVAETFMYLSREWRELNKLDHYRVNCDFGLNVVPIVNSELTLHHQLAQQQRFQRDWNVVVDWHAHLVKK